MTTESKVPTSLLARSVDEQLRYFKAQLVGHKCLMETLKEVKDVESLTSYLTRLANAHCVPLNKLAELEFAPLLNRLGPTTRAKFNSGAKNLNGVSDWTAMTISVLEKLTQRQGLRYLTLYPWRNVLVREKLLRPHLAWCPSCYTEWRQAGQTLYNPLRWHLEVVEICPDHQQALCCHCPHPDCQRQLPLVNNTGKLGYCPHCRGWLGLAAAEHRRADPEWSWQLWLTSELTKMIIAAPHLPTDPQPQTLAHHLRASLETTGPNHAVGLARQIEMSSSVIYRCLNHAQPMRLDLLAKICFRLNQSLLDIFTAEIGGGETPAHRARPQTDVNILRQQLAPFLNGTPPCSARQVAQKLGVGSNVLKHHFPEQYQHLVERYEQRRQSQVKQKHEQLQHQLQMFLQSPETPPPSLREVARRLQIHPATLTDACPEACHSLSKKYLAYRQARRMRAVVGLKRILATDETPPPSVVEAAADLDENIKYLYKRFPELCRQITQRRSNYQPVPKTRRQLLDHAKIHRQFVAILAAEEKPPPSIAEVARRLNCSDGTLHDRHPDLCTQLYEQKAAYDQAQISGLPTKVAEILAANESPAPSVREIAGRLGVQAHLLRKICPDLCAEILRRAEAERQAAKQQRKDFLDQLLAEKSVPPPALTQVAKHLNCTDAGLAEQFPDESALIVQRYQAYKAAQKQSWQDALQSALTSDQTPPPTLNEVARQLGHANSKKLRFHFPELCRQIRQQRQAHLTDNYQKLQTQFEAILAENPAKPPPTLTEVARRLERDPSTLKRLCPVQAQALRARCQHHKEAKKLAAEQALQAILADEKEEPPAMKLLVKELGYTCDTLRRYFPELMADVLAKRQTFVKARSLQRQQQLEIAVRRLTKELYDQGLDPTLRQIGLRLPNHKMTIVPHIRQAWLETRQELGLPT